MDRIHTLNHLKNQKIAKLPLAVDPESGINALISLRSAGNMIRNPIASPARTMLFNSLYVDPGHIYALQQVHSKSICFTDGKAPDDLTEYRADGLLSRSPHHILAVTVADCLPIFLADRRMGYIGILHSGWKGTGILLNSLHLMRKKWKIRNEDLAVTIGPGIGKCCYRVSENRYRHFCRQFGQKCGEYRDGEFFLDLRAANQEILAKEGIEKIDIVQNCTACCDYLNSFRRDGKDQYGLMLAMIGNFQFPEV